MPRVPTSRISYLGKKNLAFSPFCRTWWSKPGLTSTCTGSSSTPGFMDPCTFGWDYSAINQISSLGHFLILAETLPGTHHEDWQAKRRQRPGGKAKEKCGRCPNQGRRKLPMLPVNSHLQVPCSSCRSRTCSWRAAQRSTSWAATRWAWQTSSPAVSWNSLSWRGEDERKREKETNSIFYYLYSVGTSARSALPYPTTCPGCARRRRLTTTRCTRPYLRSQRRTTESPGFEREYSKCTLNEIFFKLFTTQLLGCITFASKNHFFFSIILTVSLIVAKMYGEYSIFCQKESWLVGEMALRWRWATVANVDPVKAQHAVGGGLFKVEISVTSSNSLILSFN